MAALVAIVLAAGHGTRMRSALPKVLHSVCGRPLVYYPVRAALDAGASRVVVVVNPDTKDLVEEHLSRHLPRDRFVTAIQEVPLGTGDAARAGVDDLELSPQDRVLILNGDVPLLTASELGPLVRALDEKSVRLTFMTFQAPDPTGYGRVLRDSSGKPKEIREHRDLETPEEKSVTEVNAGVYAAQFGALLSALSELSPENDQGEFYLTDIVATLALTSEVRTVEARPEVLAGVNDRAQLSAVEALLFERIRKN